MYDPPFLEALMITASFFAIFIIIVVSVLLLEGDYAVGDDRKRRKTASSGRAMRR